MRIIAVIFLSMALFNVVRAAEELAYTYDTRFRGTLYKCRITGEEINRTPNWRTSRPYPPLSPRAAVKAAIEYAIRALQEDEPVAEGDRWELLAVALRPIRGEKWLYAVDLTPPLTLGGRRMLDGRLELVRIVVLMNGQVAPLVPLPPPKPLPAEEK